MGLLGGGLVEGAAVVQLHCDISSPNRPITNAGSEEGRRLLFRKKVEQRGSLGGRRNKYREQKKEIGLIPYSQALKRAEGGGLLPGRGRPHFRKNMLSPSKNYTKVEKVALLHQTSTRSSCSDIAQKRGKES